MEFNQAMEEWEKDPEDREKLIWLGRQHSYMGRYRDAIHVYTEAMKLYPYDLERARTNFHTNILLTRDHSGDP